MNNAQVNGIILIRERLQEEVSAMTDQDILKMVSLGDTIRAASKPDVEIDYTQTQQLAIICSTFYELANDESLDHYDFEAADLEIEAMIG